MKSPDEMLAASSNLLRTLTSEAAHFPSGPISIQFDPQFFDLIREASDTVGDWWEQRMSPKEPKADGHPAATWAWEQASLAAAAWLAGTMDDGRFHAVVNSLQQPFVVDYETRDLPEVQPLRCLSASLYVLMPKVARAGDNEQISELATAAGLSVEDLRAAIAKAVKRVQDEGRG